ncbi:MAG: hypothetical protein ACR2ND_00850 [Solirubrobacteraceae bacterium]
MPRRRRAAKKHSDALSLEQSLELEVGPPVLRDVETGEELLPRVSTFASDAARRLAWDIHGERLMSRPGPVPWAHREYDGPPAC